jgi:hypothetical protein
MTSRQWLMLAVLAAGVLVVGIVSVRLVLPASQPGAPALPAPTVAVTWSSIAATTATRTLTSSAVNSTPIATPLTTLARKPLATPSDADLKVMIARMTL